MNSLMAELIEVGAGPAVEEVRALFLEYARSLDFNLCFQSFDSELRDLPGPYGRPEGRLILCALDGLSAGFEQVRLAAERRPIVFGRFPETPLRRQYIGPVVFCFSHLWIQSHGLGEVRNGLVSAAHLH